MVELRQESTRRDDGSLNLETEHFEV